MKTLQIRDFPDQIRRELKVIAAKRGISLRELVIKALVSESMRYKEPLSGE